MPRSTSSSAHAKARSETAGVKSTVASIFSGRPTSRRSSKILSDDGKSEVPPSGQPTNTASSIVRSPSLTVSDHGSSPGKPLNRHARMKKAMAEAQNDAIGEQGGLEEEGPTSSSHRDRPGSPRLNMAARAKAREEEEGRARRQAASSSGLGLSNCEKPGEGALTFDLLNGNEIVTAEGVAPSATAATNGAPLPCPPGPRLNHGPAAQDSASVSPRTRTCEDLHHGAPAAVGPSPQRASLLVPGEQPTARDAAHSMHISQSTSALLPDYYHSVSRSRAPRKYSDTSSVGVASDRGHDFPARSKKSRAIADKGGIGAALAATGAGALGLAYQGTQSLYIDRSISPAAVAAAAHAANPMVRNASHGQPVDKDFVGDSQGGLYRDPHSGAMVEKRFDGTADASAQLNVVLPRSRAVSESSIAESDVSEGLAAAAGFRAALQGGAGHLHGPGLGQNTVTASAPTIALDASHDEPEPMSSSDFKARAQNQRDGQPGLPDSASTAGWPSDVGSQITGFAVASSKRNSEFHALFPVVSEEDYLIDDYGCALVREVFIQGRLYVSENHICFNANIFGWVTNIVIPFSEIVSIEKRMTALIIPNAIQIATLHHKHTFSSFLGRDTTYDLVANIWKLSHPDVPSSAGGNAQDAEVDSDDESDGYGGAVVATPASSKMREKLKKRLKAAKSFKEADAAIKEVKATSNAVTEKTEGGKGGAGGKMKHPPTSCQCEQEKKHLAVKALETTYPTTPEKLFQLLFKNDDFMKTFWTVDEKLFELQIEEWKEDPAHEGLPSRTLSYIKPLNGSIGPKQTKCNITDETLHADPEEYISMLTTTRTPEVPSGGSFSVKTRTCITWNGGGNVAKILVTCATEWTGRSMLKGVIDKASIDGQKQYYKDLDAAMKKHIKEHKNDFQEEGDDPEEIENAMNEQIKKEAEAEGSKHLNAADSPKSGLLAAQIRDQATTICSTLSDLVSGALGEVSPSILALGGVVLLLVVSNIWALSSSGAGGGQSRDPLDPHRLRSRSSGGGSAFSSSSQSHLPVEASEIANAVRDVLRDHLGPMKGHTGSGLIAPTSRHLLTVEECRGEAASILGELEEMEGRLESLNKRWAELFDKRESSSIAAA